MLLFAKLAVILSLTPLGLKQEMVLLRNQIDKQNWKQALEVCRLIERTLAEKAPLKISDAQVLLEPADGLGMYKKAPNGVVHQNEVYLYAQVQNHCLKKTPKGFELYLVSDLIVFDSQGNELVRDVGFGTSRFEAAVPHRDTFVNIAVRATGLPQGKYRVRLLIHDRIGNKKDHADVWFEVP